MKKSTGEKPMYEEDEERATSTTFKDPEEEACVEVFKVNKATFDYLATFFEKFFTKHPKSREDRMCYQTTKSEMFLDKVVAFSASRFIVAEAFYDLF